MTVTFHQVYGKNNRVWRNCSDVLFPSVMWESVSRFRFESRFKAFRAGFQLGLRSEFRPQKAAYGFRFGFYSGLKLAASWGLLWQVGFESRFGFEHFEFRFRFGFKK